jgi:hypothetical protein
MKQRQVDTIIFATGYLFSFPFAHSSDAPFDKFPLTKPPPPHSLSPPQAHAVVHDTSRPPPSLPDSVGVRTMPPTAVPLGGVRVHNLDSFDLFYVPEPTLAFLVLPLTVVPFPLTEIQAHAIASFWSGNTPPEFTPVPRPDDDDVREDRGFHYYGFPYEFEKENALLRAIGEGGRGKTERERDEETERDSGRFLDVADWRWRRREASNELRKVHLGH